MKERRRFIKKVFISLATFYSVPRVIGSTKNEFTKLFFRVITSGVKSPEVDYPEGKRVPLGWQVFSIPATQCQDEIVVMGFPKFEKSEDPIWFRLTAAIDLREEVSILAFLPESGIEIGIFEIRFSHPFQPFQISIAPQFLETIAKEGIALRMIKGSNNAWFYDQQISHTGSLGLQPQILIGISSHSEKAFRENLLSMNSFSPFGWIGGCVLDALWEMSKHNDKEALQTLHHQLGFFLDDKKGIVFENTKTQVLDGTFNSIEDFLPFAAIAGLYPNHISIHKALDFLDSKINDEGIIISGNHITTEGCYTLAYPLAAIGVQRNNQQLVQTAIDQILFRIRFLSNSTTIYQRSSLQGNQTYANWGRGISWYLIGMAKTLIIIKNSDFSGFSGIELIEKEFVRAIKEVAKWQTEEGTWFSYIDRPETEFDSSATAGIALAFSIGTQLNLLDFSYVKKAQMAFQTLLTYLTPDGFLTNVSQINRGGEELQTEGYRVISQFAMGLMAQLKCSLDFITMK